MSAGLQGLPGPLPDGEVLLWQGAPDWRVLARRGFHVRKLAFYFAAISAAVAAIGLQQGETPAQATLAAARALLVGAAPVVLVAAFAWAVARSTVYTLTNQRVAMRIGVALSLTINLPFTRVVSADVLAHGDGSGDIALIPSAPSRLAYFMLWPHARPWRLARPQPALRGLRDVEEPARILARALAAAAGLPLPVLAPSAPAPAPTSAPVPA